MIMKTNKYDIASDIKGISEMAYTNRKPTSIMITIAIDIIILSIMKATVLDPNPAS